ncbi:MAG: methyltransferase domain-containing protein [Phycisphaerae bacterium]|nr:methyltransferase domain-containing protein [Phycisphaerae bacterium]
MSVQAIAERVLELSGSFQPACVLAAGADWDVFTRLHAAPTTADAFAGTLATDPRATRVLLDALVALELLTKQEGVYSVPADVAACLTASAAGSVLPMVLHRANCMRRWAQLSTVVQRGGPADLAPSVRGEAADRAAFIGAMHTVSGPVANSLVAAVCPAGLRHVLDVGGASGTWTMAFLHAAPEARATIFDLPPVIPMARQRMLDAGLAERVTFVPGDFYVDALPAGADAVWLSAIAHQNSREQNRALFAKAHVALEPRGVLLIRDIVMDGSRTSPTAGAMFAVNMLVGTEAGGTYTFGEYREDLMAAGFEAIDLVRRSEWMDSVIHARRRA